ncbi:MAG: caspase family protein [Spirochaetia bacterium]
MARNTPPKGHAMPRFQEKLAHATIVAGLLWMTGFCLPSLWAQEGPHFQIQMGHTSWVRAVALSPDGRYVLSASYDKTLKIWDASVGKELKTLKGHSFWVMAAAFSNDGARALSGCSDGVLKVWDVRSGGETLSIKGHADAVTSIAPSPDGVSFFSASRDGTVKRWSEETGELLGQMIGVPSIANSVTVSRDGHSILTAHEDGKLIVWDAASGAARLTIEAHARAAVQACFTPDQRSAISASRDGTAKLWDLGTGRLLRTFSSRSGEIEALAVTPDGSLLLTGSTDCTVTVWDLASGTLCWTLTGHAGGIQSLAVSADSRLAVSASTDGTLKVWSLQSGKEIQALEGKSYSLTSLAVEADGKHVIIGSKDGTLKRVEALGGRTITTYRGHTSFVNCVSISRDGEHIVSGSTDGTVRVWELVTGKELLTLKGHTSVVFGVAFTPDGRGVVSGSADGTAKLWDLATGREIHTFAGHTDTILSIDASPDGRFMLTGSKDNTLKLWDLRGGKLVWTFSGAGSWILDAAFSPDGRSIVATGSFDCTIRIIDTESGGQRLVIRNAPRITTSVAFSPDGRTIVSGSSEDVMLWDASSGRELATLKGHEQWVPAVSFSPDASRLYSGSEDGTLRCWSVADRRLLYSALYSRDGKDWLAWTQEGFFAGTDWASRNLLHIVDGMRAIGIDQVYEVYYRPDLVAAKAAGIDISSYAEGLDLKSLLQSGGLPPKVEIISPLAGSVNRRDVTLRVRVIDQGGGVGRVTIYNGDAPITLSDGSGRGLTVVAAAQGTAAAVGLADEYEALITLREGVNPIALAAYNRNNTIESRRASVDLKYGSAVVTKPRLYVLTVAVQKYRDLDLRLTYTVEDAKGIANALLKQSGGLYQSVDVYPVLDEDVTKVGLSKAFDAIAAKISPDDVFVLFFAGHGVANSKDGEYYFLPVDFRYHGAQSIVDQGISKRDILANLVKITALKSLLFFDTCNSGSFLDAPVSRGLSEKTAVDRLMRGVGRAMIMASSSDQVALEGYENHGVFTYVLLQAFSGAADADKNGYVTIKELSTFVENTVPDLTLQKWGYEQIPQSQLPQQDFPVARP